MEECARIQSLIVGLIDQELTAEEVFEVESHLIKCEACRKEYDSMIDSGIIIGRLSFKEPGDDVLDRSWKSPYGKFARNFALFLIIGAVVMDIGFAVYILIIHRSIFAVLPLAMLSMITGVAILFVIVLYEKIYNRKNDRYKEIQR